jgi:crossover junction endodeoxyribonuclease RusA
MIRVELPFPGPGLFPNRANGRHWTVLRHAKDAARNVAYALTREAMGRRAKSVTDGDVPLAITFHAPDRRKRDRDNCLAAAKHQLDGVAMALGIDDSRFEPLTVRRGEPVKGGLMVVEIGE